MLREQFLTNYLHRIEVTGNRTRLKRMFETYTNGSNVGQSNIARRYYKMKIPCAFLNDQGHCLIYGLRPLPCAAFISNNLQSCIKKQGGFMPTEMSQLFNASMRQLENCSVKLDLEADVSTMIFRQLKAIAENEAEALML
jgi:Fe-S-cluster containining protein